MNTVALYYSVLQAPVTIASRHASCNALSQLVVVTKSQLIGCNMHAEANTCRSCTPQRGDTT